MSWKSTLVIFLALASSQAATASIQLREKIWNEHSYLVTTASLRMDCSPENPREFLSCSLVVRDASVEHSFTFRGLVHSSAVRKFERFLRHHQKSTELLLTGSALGRGSLDQILSPLRPSESYYFVSLKDQSGDCISWFENDCS